MGPGWPWMRPPRSWRGGIVVLLTAIGVTVALGLVPGPVAAQRSIIIEELSAEITVRADGDIVVTETLRPRFEGEWNGVRRLLELRPPADYGADYLMEARVLSATDESGRPLRFEVSRPDRAAREIRVWVPDARDRTATVLLTYQVGNALGFFEPDSATGHTLDELSWQVTGTDWEVPILSASARVVLPGDAQPVQAAAYVGGPASTEQVPVVMEDGAVSVPAVDRLDPGQGLTVAVGWPAGEVPRPPARSADALRAQSGGTGRVGPAGFGPAGPASPLALWPLLLPFGVFWLTYRTWARRGKDPAERAIAVQWEPPAGLSPAEAGTLIDHDAGMHDIVAILVDLAVRGLIVIEERKRPGFLSFGKEYAFHLMEPASGWTELADHERTFLHALFTTTTRRAAIGTSSEKPGFLGDVVQAFTGKPAADGAPEDAVDSVLLSELENRFYKKVPAIKDGVYGALVEKGYYLRRPDKVRARWMVLALACAALGGIGLAGVAGGTATGALSGIAVLAAGVASAVIVAVFGWLMPARTEAGARAREAALGFRRFLERVETPRYRRMITSPELFERYLPFAMAFRCEKEWAKAFEDLVTEPPDWYRGAPHGMFRAGAFARDLNTLSTAAASTLSSSPSSSGSGGGGSVGGGGGGGGVGGF